MVDSQTRRRDKLRPIGNLEELNPDDRSERQLSLFNDGFNSIESKKILILIVAHQHHL